MIDNKLNLCLAWGCVHEVFKPWGYLCKFHWRCVPIFSQRPVYDTLAIAQKMDK